MNRRVHTWAWVGSCLALAGPVAAAEPVPPSAPPAEAPRPAEPPAAASPPSDSLPSDSTPPAAPPAAAEVPAARAPSNASEPVGSGSGLFEASQSAAATDSQGAVAEGNGSGLPFELNGYVRGDMFVGKAVDSSKAQMHAAYGEFALKARSEKQSYGDAFAELRLRYGQEGDRHDLQVTLREAYVNTYVGPLDLRLGQQIIVWGRADAFNPTNNLTPIDLRVRSPLEDDRRLGNVGARAFLNFAPVRIEGVWMPLYVASELPAIPLPPYIHFGPPNYPAPTLDNGLYAGRVHLELPSFEASVSALYGHAPLPGLALHDYTVGVDPPEIRISRVAYDQQVFGGDFSTAFGEILGLRGEIAYRHPLHHKSRPYAARPDLQYVLGVDRTFGPVSVILQYLGRYVLDWQREPGAANPIDPLVLAMFQPPLPPALAAEVDTSIAQELANRNQILFGQTERVQHLASARVEWLSLRDTLSLSALGLVNFSTREWLLFPKMTYKITDSLSTSLGGEIYAGPDGTLFGAVDELLTAGYAELRMSF
jgi:hypothetical protein